MSYAVAWIGLAVTWIVATIGVTIMWPDMRRAAGDARRRLRHVPPELERTVDLGPAAARARAHVPPVSHRRRGPRRR